VPRLWTDTLDEHRQAVRDATLDATAALVTERGLYGVTMSEIATRTGIGRATLYKYFPDVQSILIAWHERAIAMHLRQLTALARADGQPLQRLTAVFEAYAAIEHAHGDHPLAPLVHGGAHHARGRNALVQLLAELIAQCAANGDVRADIPADELAGYSVHALGAAAELPASSVATVVALTLAALRR
jgi:AcrR family transcriptional regulator